MARPIPSPSLAPLPRRAEQLGDFRLGPVKRRQNVTQKFAGMQGRSSPFVPRNTIETIFCRRRNHIPAVGLNVLPRSGRPRDDGCCMAAPWQHSLEGSKHAGMRALPRKARTGCPFPQFVERPLLVVSHSFLLGPVRGRVQGAIRRQRPSFGHLPRAQQQTELTGCPRLSALTDRQAPPSPDRGDIMKKPSTPGRPAVALAKACGRG